MLRVLVKGDELLASPYSGEVLADENERLPLRTLWSKFREELMLRIKQGLRVWHVEIIEYLDEDLMEERLVARLGPARCSSTTRRRRSN